MIPFALLLRLPNSPTPRRTWIIWVHAWQATEAMAQVAGSGQVRVLGVMPIENSYRSI